LEEKYVITSIGKDGKSYTEIKTYKELHPGSKATHGAHGTGDMYLYYTSNNELQSNLTHYDKSFGDVLDETFNFGIMIWGGASNSSQSIARKLKNPKIFTTVDKETLDMINLMRKQDKYKAPGKPSESKTNEGIGKGAGEAMKAKDEAAKAKSSYPHPVGDISGVIKPLSGETFNGKELWYTTDRVENVGDVRKYWITKDNSWLQVDIDSNKIVGTFIPETKTVSPEKK
jgi:hypothetical protein